jgi:hypothetical protein
MASSPFFDGDPAGAACWNATGKVAAGELRRATRMRDPSAEGAPVDHYLRNLTPHDVFVRRYRRPSSALPALFQRFPCEGDVRIVSGRRPPTATGLNLTHVVQYVDTRPEQHTPEVVAELRLREGAQLPGHDTNYDGVIVSQIAAAHLILHGCDGIAEGTWVYSPDTGPDSAIRNSKGQIVAVERLLLIGVVPARARLEADKTQERGTE